MDYRFKIQFGSVLLFLSIVCLVGLDSDEPSLHYAVAATFFLVFSFLVYTNGVAGGRSATILGRLIENWLLLICLGVTALLYGVAMTGHAAFSRDFTAMFLGTLALSVASYCFLIIVARSQTTFSASLLPSRQQWKRWSLPSRLTAVGALIGATAIPLSIILYVGQEYASRELRTLLARTHREVVDTREIVSEANDRIARNTEATDSVAATVEESFEAIIEAMGQEEKIDRAMSLFETHNYDKAAVVFSSALAGADEAERDYLQDSLISSLYGAGDFERAARLVLERDRNRPPGDTGLWKDVALCIRQYSAVHSTPAGFTLVQTLQEQYGDKLISYLWTVIPTRVIVRLYEGLHYTSYIAAMSADERQAIRHILKEYPHGRFDAAGMYALGEYDLALKEHPDSMFRDLLLFARGYESGRRLGCLYVSGPYETDPDTGLRFVGVDRKEEADDGTYAHVATTREYLTRLVAEFPTAPMIDDTYGCLGNIAVWYGDFDEGISWLRRAAKHNPRWGSCETAHLARLPTESLIERLEVDPAIPRPDYLWYLVVRDRHRVGDFSGARQLALRAFKWMETLGSDPTDHIVDRLEYFIKTGGMVESAQGAGRPRTYRNLANELRRVHHDYRAAVAVLEDALRKFPDSDESDKLGFVRILCFRDWRPKDIYDAGMKFIDSWPDSTVADDVLAEMIFVASMTHADFERAENTLQLLLDKYPQSNAVDNAMNWLAWGYLRKGELERAEVIYTQIREWFPFSRFARYAEQGLAKIEKKRRKPVRSQL